MDFDQCSFDIISTVALGMAQAANLCGWEVKPKTAVSLALAVTDFWATAIDPNPLTSVFGLSPTPNMPTNNTAYVCMCV